MSHLFYPQCDCRKSAAMGTHSFGLWTCTLFVMCLHLSHSAGPYMTTSSNEPCAKPKYIESVLQFLDPDGPELNSTGLDVFPDEVPAFSSITFVCRNPGQTQLEGMNKSVCVSGQWLPEAPTCMRINTKIAIGPESLHMQVDRNGTVTVTLPVNASAVDIAISCLVSVGQPELVHGHIHANGTTKRARLIEKRGDAMKNNSLILRPAQVSDSGVFTCRNTNQAGDNISLDIQFFERDIEPENCSKGALLPSFATDKGQSTRELSWPSPVFPNVTGVTFNASHNFPYNFSIGMTTVVYKALDGLSEATLCWLEFTIQDEEPPVFHNCPDDVFKSTDPGVSYTMVLWNEPTVTDNTEHFNLIISGNNSHPFYSAGVTEIVFLATDFAGNEGNCTFYIVIEDNEPPSITCPDSTTIDLPKHKSQIKIKVKTHFRPTYADNALDQALEPIVEGVPKGRIFGPGVYEITYRIYDEANNTNSCVFNITVQDTEYPLFYLCPPDQRVLLDPSQGNLVNVTWNEPEVRDNVGVVDTTSNSSDRLFPIGEHLIIYTARDESLNEAVCSFYITVEEAMCSKTMVSISGVLYQWPSSLPATNVSTFQTCSLLYEKAGQPLATRDCVFDPQVGVSWSPPAYTNCGGRRLITSVRELNKGTVDIFTVEDVARVLQSTLMNKSYVDEDDVAQAADLLTQISSVKLPLADVADAVVNVADAIIRLDNKVVTSPRSLESSSKIVKAIEKQVSTCARSGIELDIHTENIVVQTSTVMTVNDIDSIPMYKFEVPDDGIDGDVNNDYGGIQPSISVPLSAIQSVTRQQQNSTGNMISLSFIFYRSSFFFSSSLDKQQNAMEGNITGGVISATVTDMKVSDLNDPVVIVLPSMGQNLTDRTASCVFWDFSLNDGFGDWSSEGCSVALRDDDKVICHCDHLTNFAVLVDFTGQNPAEYFVLDILSKVGCVLSIAGLLVTIFTFITFRSLRNSRSRQILINLCVSLLLLYVVFLGGIDLIRIDSLCYPVAILLHYFLLTTMFWMAVEAQNMYLLLVKVFQSDIRRFLLKASLFAWGVPVIIVLMSLIITAENYRHDGYCFLNPGLNMFLSLLAPVAIILFHNFIIFAMVVWRLMFTDVAGKAVNQTKTQQIVSRLQNAVCMSVLLGLTWSLGFMAIRRAEFIFQLLFCIVNSLQGFLVFLLFCVRANEVRSAYKACMPWLDIEMNIHGQSYKLQEKSLYQLRGRIRMEEDPLWNNSRLDRKSSNTSSWPEDTPGLEPYMNTHFEKQMSTTTDTSRLTSFRYSLYRSHSRVSNGFTPHTAHF